MHAATVQPFSPSCPVGPKHMLVCGAFWMMRELELGCAQVGHVSLDLDAMAVEWRLPASKTDVKALGISRRWGCVCVGALDLPCPVHAVIGQLRLLAHTFGQAKVDKGLLPMFPSASGGFVDKRHVVTCIEAVATLIGEPLEDHRGVRRYGGHSLRVTGARTMAALGIEIHLIQLMARWSSDVVHRYVADAPLSRMTAAYQQGYAAIKRTQSGTVGVERACEQPLPPNVGDGSKHPSPFVLNLDSGVAHRPVVWSLEVQPQSWRTVCGWTFGFANTRGVSEVPTKSSLICTGCCRAEKTAARENERAENVSDSSSSGSSS